MSFSNWDQFSTVSFRREQQKDEQRRSLFFETKQSYLAKCWFEASSWVIPAIVGFLTAQIAANIEKAVRILSSLRHGFCLTSYFAPVEQCCTPVSEMLLQTGSATPMGGGMGTGGGLVGGSTGAVVPGSTLPEPGSAIGVNGGGSLSAPHPIQAPIIHHNPFQIRCEDESLGQIFRPWSELLPFPGGLLSPSTTQALYFFLISLSYTMFVACIVYYFAPAARGSGIPEIKTVLGGFHMPAVLSKTTLLGKCIGLPIVVAASMSLGKEGPLVHVACCIAVACSVLHSRYAESQSKMRELISSAAAAGVSVAFGAPLGGVLFSFEEVSTFFPQRTLSRSFFAAVVAALSLQYCNVLGNHKLTLFEVKLDNPLSTIEYIPFAFLGILGGCIGAFFISLNVRLTAMRSGPMWKSRVPMLLEVCVISCLTFGSNAMVSFLQPISSSVIHRLFSKCEDLTGQEDPLGLCKADGNSNTHTALYLSLLAAASLRLLQTVMTFGTGIPAGLFVPSLFVGACVGRVVGMWVSELNAVYGFCPTVIEPGVYAMVGAAATLGGVCRVTISLVVIMFELTGALSHICPFMVAVQMAKWTGDFFNMGIYDCYIVLRGYPFLHEPEDVTYSGRACDIMDDDIEVICVEDDNTIGSMREMLDEFPKYNGFPLVKTENDEYILLGYIHSLELQQALQEALGDDDTLLDDESPVAFTDLDPSAGDYSCLRLDSLVDDTIIRIVPDTPLSLVHNVFRQLGLRFVMIVFQGKLKGLITKKAFVKHMHQGHLGHAKGNADNAKKITHHEMVVDGEMAPEEDDLAQAGGKTMSTVAEEGVPVPYLYASAGKLIEVVNAPAPVEFSARTVEPVVGARDVLRGSSGPVACVGDTSRISNMTCDSRATEEPWDLSPMRKGDLTINTGFAARELNPRDGEIARAQLLTQQREENIKEKKHSAHPNGTGGGPHGRRRG